MLRTILLIGYLIIGVYCLYRTYVESEIEDRRDFKYIIGIAMTSMFWPLIYLITVALVTIEDYYEEED